MRSSPCDILNCLRPDKLCWIEFGSSDWKFKNNETLLRLNKGLNRFTFVNWMAIPDQYNVTTNQPKNLFQKSNYFFARETVSIRFYAQTNFLSF